MAIRNQQKSTKASGFRAKRSRILSRIRGKGRLIKRASFLLPQNAIIMDGVLKRVPFLYRPQSESMYIHAFDRYLECHHKAKLEWSSGQEVYKWWITRKVQEGVGGQLNIEEYLAGLADDDDDEAL